MTPRALRIGVAVIAIALILMPVPDPVVIRFRYSPDAKGVLEPLIERFNESQNEVLVLGVAASSGVVLDGLLSRGLEIEVWMPAASTWGVLLNHELDDEVAPSGSRGLFWSPEVIGTFRSVTSDGATIRDWDDIVALATGAKVLDDRDRPFRFGHSKPIASTSGLYAMLALFDAADPGVGLSTPDARSIATVREAERSVLNYGAIAEDLCPVLQRHTDSYVSAFYMQETTLLNCRLRGEAGVVEVIPPRTFIADYPIYVLDAGWVREAERRAAERFVSFLDEHLARELVVQEQSFRLGYPWDEDGFENDAAPIDDEGGWEPIRVGATEAEALLDVRDAGWPAVRKRANLMIVLERSEMGVGGRLTAAKRELSELVDELAIDGATRVGLITFDAQTVERNLRLAPLTQLYRDRLDLELQSIGSASGRDGRLCDAVDAAVDDVDDEDSINLVLVVARGQDASRISCEAVEARLVELSGRTSPVQVHTLSFGDPSGDGLLCSLATASLGGFEDRAPDEPPSACVVASEDLVDSLDGLV